ncbi:MAG: Do family serine endopeptidase, partial [Bacteroidota bacterium]
RFIFSLMIASLMGGGIALLGAGYFFSKKSYHSIEERQQQNYTVNYEDVSAIVPEGLNFLQAAELVRPAVVHIKIAYQKRISRTSKDYYEDMFRNFHGERGPGLSSPRQSTGSGVIISDDGYIVTNYHVIDNASKIEVVLNDRRSYVANLVGSDKTTDLALLKIQGDSFPFVRYGDSEHVKVGEWVLAVGNPFDLTSTVTAGIVSAKSRSINLLKDKYAIEAFIQTDAAVNPGNSGGALVNLRGELIGVNTAIATNTGYYAGYSFAIPISIVRKVMDDLKNYGSTQRALLGVRILEVDAKLAKEKKLGNTNGVYIKSLNKNGAAQQAGLQPGDVIHAIDSYPVNSGAELQKVIALHRPGDEVKVGFTRNGKKRDISVVLRDEQGSIKKQKNGLFNQVQIFGAVLHIPSFVQKQRLGISAGVQVSALKPGKFMEAGLKTGFIITQIDRKEVKNPSELKEILENFQGTLTLNGFYPNGQKA